MSRRKIKDKQKQILNEIHYLVKVCGLPMTLISKRVGLGLKKLRGIIKSDIDDPDIAFTKSGHSPRFAKIHERAQDVIKSLFENTDHPLCLREVQSVV